MMSGDILAYAAGAVITVWGVAHIVPTRAVVAGFGPLTTDNSHVLKMEWVAEGLFLIFLGVLPIVATAFLGRTATGSVLVCRSVAVMLAVLGAWTAVTGGRTGIVQFKICVAIKLGAAIALGVSSVIS